MTYKSPLSRSQAVRTPVVHRSAAVRAGHLASLRTAGATAVVAAGRGVVRVVEHAGVEVDSDELRHAGNRLLEISDTVLRAGSTDLCVRTDTWGSVVARAAGGRFAGRFGYLLRTLAEELEDAGHQLRLSAEGYDYVDMDVAGRLAGGADDLAFLP